MDVSERALQSTVLRAHIERKLARYEGSLEPPEWIFSNPLRSVSSVKWIQLYILVSSDTTSITVMS
jgi:hypothetical protein